MHSRFNDFTDTPLGQQLTALIDTPTRYIEYVVLSRVGLPAVAALVDDLQHYYPEISTHDTARQYCGAMVAEVMRRHHHDIAQARGRVPGGYFTYGTVWNPVPGTRSYDYLLEQLATMTDNVKTFIDKIPSHQWLTRQTSGFSLTEHICHMRDLDKEGFGLRLDRLLTETMPVLEDFDGTAIANQRHYQQQDLQAALADFIDYRQELIQRFAAVPEQDRARQGIKDGNRLNIHDLLDAIHQHDNTHLMELEELVHELQTPSLPQVG